MQSNIIIMTDICTSSLQPIDFRNCVTPRPLEVRPYNTVTVTHEENRKGKTVDMETGSGFKVLTNKALKKSVEQYPTTRYEYEPNSTIIGRQLLGDGTAIASVTFRVREKERIEKKLIVETRANELDEVDAQISKYYYLGDVDKEDYLKALTIAKATAQFKLIKSQDENVNLVGIFDIHSSPNRVTVEIKYTELP